jgi:hypothetical protein
MNNLPLLLIENNKVIGISKTKRKPMFENQMCESVGLVATCNACDRIIFKDENWLKGYKESFGYCRECANENS